MKFHFKIQQFQTDAVESIINIFNGQAYNSGLTYIRDIGLRNNDTSDKKQKELGFIDEFNETIDLDDVTGFKNAELGLSDNHLFSNIRNQQDLNNIKQSYELTRELGRCALDVEMETGTGKTYVYIKTMFELNKRYGWTKFIVVVPSVAIREGVKKSFEQMQEHFMEHYGKKARYFVYDSKNLEKIDTYSSSSGINVMIINTQAFAKDFKEKSETKPKKKNAENAVGEKTKKKNDKKNDIPIIFRKQDNFNSRRPIDVIKANRPILILDEPQKLTGSVTQKNLKEFNPLFSLNYSATHAKKHNLIYVLDALDAYNKRLVKKIEVKGFEVKNFRGSDKYLYLDNIILSSNKPPRARLELEINYKKSINRESRILDVGDDLYATSNNMEQYKDGYTITEIDPITSTVSFANGLTIEKGSLVGDISEKDMRRIQIRETINSHFEKEKQLFNMGIKSLSLFFIDEVAKYRQYDENNEEMLGEYAKIFEEEYISILNEQLELNLENQDYQKYLRRNEVNEIHKGYFSIDKAGKSIDSKTKSGSDASDDISAYDLILKNKERLLSFDEPTRFIFSHSALREGWDNPNVFQICTLKHSDNTTVKRQEVGRGLRLCVNKDGTRIDSEYCGDSVHDINMLTVIASESYQNFVSDLQKEIKTALYDRPTKATVEYFEGKNVKLDENIHTITNLEANQIYRYLIKNDYIDDSNKVADTYRKDVENKTLATLPDTLTHISEQVHILVQAIFNENMLKHLVSNGNKTKVVENKLNDNFYKKEFQTLWGYINRKYSYNVSVNFDSEELISKAVRHINEKLFVSELKYTATKGVQRTDLNEHELARGESFTGEKTKTEVLRNAQISQVKYDLIGKIAIGATLTRKTTVKILQRIDESRLMMFKVNPEEFISKTINLIKEQKATMIVSHIEYNRIDGEYDSTIFTAQKNNQPLEKAFKANRHIQDYVFTDGIAENSIEYKFAANLDSAEEVCVYAKLPKGFAIPTPLGNYSPDWAIAFEKDSVKHIFFIAETKGTMESLQLRPIEQAKIMCAKKLFNNISTSKVRYHDVDNYQNLLTVIENMK